MYAAHKLAKFCDDLEPVHWEAETKVLRYVWRKNDLGNTYDGLPSNDVTMVAYAKCPKKQYSIQGKAVLLGGSTISGFSRAKRVTASASSEPEYVAIAKIVNAAKFLRRTQEFITPTLRSSIVPVREDN